MNRLEALRLLGLDESASTDDIKTAYKETVQILHPDKFEGNKKLQTRATEQFKNLQDAYNYLTSTKFKTASEKATKNKVSNTTRSQANGNSYQSSRIAGITAARIQLVKQRDALLDERKKSITFCVVGLIVSFVTIRRPFGIMGILAGFAGAFTIWSIIQIVSIQSSLAVLNKHIESLRREERVIAAQIDQ